MCFIFLGHRPTFWVTYFSDFRVLLWWLTLLADNCFRSRLSAWCYCWKLDRHRATFFGGWPGKMLNARPLRVARIIAQQTSDFSLRGISALYRAPENFRYSDHSLSTRSQTFFWAPPSLETQLLKYLKLVTFRSIPSAFTKAFVWRSLCPQSSWHSNPAILLQSNLPSASSSSNSCPAQREPPENDINASGSKVELFRVSRLEYQV